MMQAMIFAAGLGTRLRPLTDTRPKALVEVGGLTLLDITVSRLRRAGFGHIVVNVHHFGQQIIDHIAAHWPGDGILVSDERGQLLDTGGGLRHAAPLFSPDAPILIHNVDILHNVDLRRLYAAHRGDATLLVSERQTSRYLLFDRRMRLAGWTNVDTGEVRTPYPSLDVALCSRYAFSGLHVFSPALFGRMQAEPAAFGIIPFYLSQCREADIRGLEAPGLRLLDVGKTAALARAEDFLRQNY